MKLKLTRNVTIDECPWLERDYKEGEIVYEFYGATYGCITGSGTAVTEKQGQEPFFELPLNSVMAA